MSDIMRDLLKRAIAIIDTERACLFEGHQIDGIVTAQDETDQLAIDAMEAMDDWLFDARTALIAPAGGVTVRAYSAKQLDWIRVSGDEFQVAGTPFGGSYNLSAYAGMSKPFKLEKCGFDGSPTLYFETEEQAMLAAQADYETRLLSAVTFEPSPDPARIPCILHPMGIGSMADALGIVNAIDLLRGDEGNSVTFVCDNPDFNGLPNARIVCNGNWTGWEDRVFSADTVTVALQMAVAEQMKGGK